MEKMKALFTSTPKRRVATAALLIILAFVLFYIGLIPLLSMRERKDINRALSSVFPSASHFEPVQRNYSSQIEAVFAVTADNSDTIGYLYNVNENGISGQLDFFVGLDTSGRVIGIYFPYFDEPVSYDDMNAVNAFLDSFKGKEGILKGVEGTATQPGDITIIGGAEVTCYAIIDGVNVCMDSFFNAYGQEENE